MQNFKWFRKCCRTKNSSAKLLFFQSSSESDSESVDKLDNNVTNGYVNEHIIDDEAISDNEIIENVNRSTF
jgi:hypothetical protein